MTRCTLLTIAALCCCSVLRAAEPSFESDVRPILKAYCFQCHGEQGKKESGLDVRLRRLMITGGESGPAIVPGKPDESPLLEKIRAGEMPPGKDAKKLAPAQVALIERWIASGAPTARPEPEAIASGMLITPEDRQFWSFQPIRRSAVPTPQHIERVRTPVDAFLLQRLEAAEASFAPDADPRTLLRRAYFDLLGLPPSPEEVDEFVAQFSTSTNQDSAYESLLDKLLASPQYGERWGRHWLDVAGYADSDGYSPADPVREHIYHYRDYVIRSFNADKPFDEFIREQLAGDEMVPRPHQGLAPEQIEKLVATGFLVMAPNPLASNAGIDPRMSHDIWVSEAMKIVSTSLLGMSVGCAQCHDHRFDPISQEDYYRFRAIFEPAFDLAQWRVPRQRLVSLFTDADRAQVAEVEAEAKLIDEEKKQFEEVAYQRVLESELEKVPEADRAAVRKAHLASQRDRTPEERALLRQYPRLNFTVSNLPVYDRAAAAEASKIGERAAAIRARAPKERFIQIMAEAPGSRARTFLLARGDYQQPKQVLLPGELTILSGDEQQPISVDEQSLPTTGRRLAYARLLTSGKHPLLARVLVNRVWMHHFGRGLVTSPADFGVLGARPSHPELLDWLASEFMTPAAGGPGWGLKRLHKLIMTSTAYRQALRSDARLQTADPENRLLGGFEVRRLEAEVIRDSILAVSGQLNSKQFGPAVPVMRDPAGEIVVGIENTNAGLPGPPVAMNGEDFRRSIYVQARRSRPLTMLQTFDGPLMEPNCTARSASTVAPQSLMLMNGAFVIAQSRAFAKRVQVTAGDDIKARVAEAWKLAFSRLPTGDEQSDALAFLQSRTEYFRANPPQPEPPADPNPRRATAAVEPPAVVPLAADLEALAVLCQTLFSSNEFLYVD